MYKKGSIQMQIAICDDDKIFRDDIINFLIDYKKQHLLHIDIFEYENGNELLSSTDLFDIIFLDYQMPCVNGLEIARQIRARNSICSIVFITNYPDFVYDSFEVNPYRFFTKPVMENKLIELMNSYIAQQKLLAPIIVINDCERIIIESKNILYLEANGKYCKIFTGHHIYNSSKTLSHVHELLPQHCFYRTHKSFVVNFYYINSYNDNYITLTDGSRIDLARSKRAEFKNTFSLFIRDYYKRI